jgi:metal-dependent amidase/aminoacylase/carboxypeptidase family protein
MRVPERDGRAVKRHLHSTFGHGRVRTMYASVPFRGEDFALFLDRLPGTYTYLGVRAPGAGIESSYPHLATFTPDEGAIGFGTRAMAGWLATRAHT